MNRPHLFALVLCLGMCGVSPAQEPGATQLHVAPDGSDTNSGTRENPLATIGGARDAIRTLKRDGLKTPIDVLVQSGTYYCTEPMKFGARDSGTRECPITYKAAPGAKAVLSGGVPLTGWKQVDDATWAVNVPPAVGDFRLLRVGDGWATRARHPNADPAEPYTGGWLFADGFGEPWEQGLFDVAVQNTQTAGSKLTWKVRVPAAGKYRVWLRYAHNMGHYNQPDLSGRSVIRANGGKPVPLRDLSDTGGFSKFRWAHVADLKLAAGQQTLQWINVTGGGLALDALAFCDDETWSPEAAFVIPNPPGPVQVKPPAEGRQLVVVQAEACTKSEGPEVRVPEVCPPGTTREMRFRPGDLPKIADLRRAEIHMVIADGYVNAILPIDGIDYKTRRIGFPGNGTMRDVRVGNRYFLENAREAFDAPGEWFLDTWTKQLLYHADQPDFPSVPTVASALESLIVLEGDAAKNDYVEHLAFEGLRFVDTTYTVADDYYHPADAAIVMAGARHCAVRTCEFTRIGGYALRLSHRTEQCTFRENHVHHVGQGGVIAIGGTKEQSHHCAVLGNVMEHLGLIYKHVAGVYLTHGSDHHIAHNRIADVPRYAISFKSQGEDRLCHRNIIEFNDIRRCNLETNDSGAIESLGYERRDSGNVIRHNLILDSVGLKTSPSGRFLSPHMSWGIYLDDFSSGTTVYGNIVARNRLGGGCIHGGQNNVFENNIFVDGYEHQMRLQPRDEFMKANKFVRNVVVFSRPEAHLFYASRDQPGMFSECDNNLYWLVGADLKAHNPSLTPAGSFAQWQAAGFDTHSLVADPLFVDAAHDDFRLQPESPAFRLGFQPIPVEKIGPQGLAP